MLCSFPVYFLWKILQDLLKLLTTYHDVIIFMTFNGFWNNCFNRLHWNFVCPFCGAKKSITQKFYASKILYIFSKCDEIIVVNWTFARSLYLSFKLSVIWGIWALQFIPKPGYADDLFMERLCWLKQSDKF